MSIKIPEKFSNQYAKSQWLNANWRLSMDDILSSSDPSTDLLMTLLGRVRYAVRHAGLKKDGTFRLSTLSGRESVTGVTPEEVLRNEVRDHPSKFLFYNEALVTYHPIHLAEMITILLAILLTRGVDGRINVEERRIPGEIIIGDSTGKAPGSKK